jgi:hypothetical protein
MRPSSDAATPARLARALPGVPHWVETRSMLHLGDCELFGLEEGEELSFVVRDTGRHLVWVVGHPPENAIWKAVAGAATYEIFVRSENGTYVAAALPGWSGRLRRCSC